MNVNPDEYVVVNRNKLFYLILNGQVDSDGNSVRDHDAANAWIDEHQVSLMTIPQFQKSLQENSLHWFPDAYVDDKTAMMTNVLGIAGEAGEMIDNLKKWIRKSLTWEELLERNKVESIDVMHYLFQYWDMLGVDVAAEYLRKTAINEERFGPQKES